MEKMLSQYRLMSFSLLLLLVGMIYPMAKMFLSMASTIAFLSQTLRPEPEQITAVAHLNESPIIASVSAETMEKDKPRVSLTKTSTNVITPAPTVTTVTETKREDKPISRSLLNAQFEETEGNWVRNWNRDSDVFSLDTTSKGNTGSNSVHVTTNIFSPSQHMYSEFFTIESEAPYLWNTFINAVTLNGLELYIDEYDGNGKWLSGVYMGKIDAPMNGTHTVKYTPTVNIVRIVRLQYITTNNVDNDLYLDSVSLTN